VKLPDICKATIFAGDFDDHPSEDYMRVEKWLNKWRESIVVAEYTSGGWEHIWNVSGPKEAIKEIPEDLLCASEWAGYS
jgi:hypothetical protein